MVTAAGVTPAVHHYALGHRTPRSRLACGHRERPRTRAQGLRCTCRRRAPRASTSPGGPPAGPLAPARPPPRPCNPRGPWSWRCCSLRAWRLPCQQAERARGRRARQSSGRRPRAAACLSAARAEEAGVPVLAQRRAASAVAGMITAACAASQAASQRASSFPSSW